MATMKSAADFGASKAGLSTVGYRLRNDDGTDNGARITAGIVELGDGVYSAASVTIPNGFSGFVRWDTGESAARVVYDPYVVGGGSGGGSTLYGETGAIAKALSVNDVGSGLALPGVAVYVSADIAGTQRSQTKITDDAGQVTFHLDAGTVYLWLSRHDRTFANPYVETVA